MKNVLLIGAGRFGRHIAMQLSQLGHQVMAVDTNEERINDVLPFVTNAQIGDSTNAEFLRSLGIGNFDVCFVTISGNFQGAAQAFQSSLASQPWLILAALVAVYIILGVLYGSIEGYYGGAVDMVMERISDVLNSVPFMVVATLFQLQRRRHRPRNPGARCSVVWPLVWASVIQMLRRLLSAINRSM